jgi:hypothetical protein
MTAGISSAAVLGSHSTVQLRSGTLSTRAGSLATIAPAFFLFGAGAVAYADPAPDSLPELGWIRYESSHSSTTKSVLETLKQPSTEQLIITKLDVIFENLLASQQDLELADQNAIASNLWQLYQ